MRDLADPEVREALSDRLGELYAGRPALLGPGILAAYPNVAAWLERGLARPAVQRGLTIPARPN